MNSSLRNSNKGRKCSGRRSSVADIGNAKIGKLF